jgi:predicted permease
VTAAGLTSNVPFNGMTGSGSYFIVGRPLGPTEAPPHGRQELVGGDYFRAMRIPLVKGRVFTDADGPDSPPVVVIDQYLVDRYFRDVDPIGQQIQRGGPTSKPFTVIGVVGTINSTDLGEPVTKERLYFALSQTPFLNMALVVKTTLDPTALAAQVRSAVRSIDPEQPLADVRTLDQWIGRSLATRRAPTLLLTLFGAVALLLSAIGIYGVVAFGVSERVREFGIRQALGADRNTIVGMVLTQGVRSAAIGVVLGLVGAVALSRFLESLLYGVSTRDLAVFAGAAGLLLVAASVACYVPARGTTRLDPMKALRDS